MVRALLCHGIVGLCIGLVLPTSALGQEATPTSEKALQLLKDGNARFVADKPAARDMGDKKRKELAKGQHPFAIVLASTDSRVAPELVFDQGLGDLFVLRVAGNVVDPAELGSIEYAVEHFKTRLIVVLGHEDCGAVKAALSGDKLEGNLANLIDMVQPGKDLPKDKKETLAAGIKNNASNQGAGLTAKSDVIKEFVANGRVRIVTGVYSLESGKVGWLEAPKGQKEK